MPFRRTRTRSQPMIEKLRNTLKFHVKKYEMIMTIIHEDIRDTLNSQNGA